MTTTDHTPSRRCYQRGCRLPECAHQDYVYRKQLDLDHLAGRRRMVDATQARVHAEQLQAAGWTYRQIGDTAGVSESAVHAVARGQAEARSSTVLGILSVHIVRKAESTIDATGTRRRIQALMYIGHTCRTIGAQAGYSADWMARIAAGWLPTVNRDTAAAVARAYRQLVTQPGASSKTRAHARKHNWHGPLAWDEIDNPDAQPETDSLDDAVTDRRPRVLADPARVARLTAQGLSAEQIAQRIGCHKRSVVRARRRAADMAVAA